MLLLFCCTSRSSELGALVQRGFEILPLDLNNKNLEIKFYEVREGESTTALPDTEHTYPCGIRYSGHYE